MTFLPGVCWGTRNARQTIIQCASFLLSGAPQRCGSRISRWPVSRDINGVVSIGSDPLIPGCSACRGRVPLVVLLTFADREASRLGGERSAREQAIERAF